MGNWISLQSLQNHHHLQIDKLSNIACYQNPKENYKGKWGPHEDRAADARKGHDNRHVDVYGPEFSSLGYEVQSSKPEREKKKMGGPYVIVK